MVFEKAVNKTALLSSLKENMIFELSYFASYVPSLELIKNDAIILRYPVKNDTFNCVIDARFTKKNAFSKIDEILELFYEKELPFTWWVCPGDTPSNLKELLIEKGLICKSDYGMFLPMHNYVSKAPSLLEIHQLTQKKELSHFDQVLVEAGSKPGVFLPLLNKLPKTAYDLKAPYRFYVGYREGRPVVTGVVTFYKEMPGIYYIVTTPNERKKGYATEMMHYLLFLIKKLGYKTALLQSSQAGKKMYDNLGFIECCLIWELELL